MKPVIHHVLTVLWGLATPILMGYGAQALLTEATADSEHIGHPTPLEFIVLFFFIGLVCLGVYLIYDLLWVLFRLPKEAKRVKCFFQSLLLYVLVCLGGWIVLALLEEAVDSLFF